MDSYLNPNLQKMSEDVLYHFDLSNKKYNFPENFGDIKFVLTGGSNRRMEWVANYLRKELRISNEIGQGLVNIAEGGGRYAMYKVGPVLCVSHGIGSGSISIMLHEIFKLLWHANCEDVTFFRLGSSGGLGQEPGTICITTEAVDGELNPFYEMIILGKRAKRPTEMDKTLIEKLIQSADNYNDEIAHQTKDAEEKESLKIVTGKTMCADDFYEGQGRIDGAICDYSEEDKKTYLRYLYNNGVRNIEMESTVFAALCRRAGFKAAVICVVLLDRFKGDQITASQEQVVIWERNPIYLVTHYMRQNYEFPIDKKQ